MRFVFRPPATDGAGLLELPWPLPSAKWHPSLVLEVPQRGLSRHVVRFVAQEGGVFALKEISEPLARCEYVLLSQFQEEGLPAVPVLGGTSNTRATRHLTFACDEGVCRNLVCVPEGS
ncbi:hypothetical protein SAMN05660748_0002 [Blastococcus aggregatus]|uniref:Uncharacterized protein n=1 Tax=Blastococcus aggregatus TaxID=38502 RepID=A0A285VHS5_9ACTN|nr:hypothetical protein SAMN05660748_0002 [Blastococcus aggregatus]